MIGLFLFAASTTLIHINEQPLSVELAITPEERSIGLMGRTALPDGSGMLFMFDEPKILTFWMKNTRIPLSVGFFDEKHRLINIEEMDVPCGNNLPVYQSREKAKYALEVPKGWFQKNGIQPHVRFEWDGQESELKLK